MNENEKTEEQIVFEDWQARGEARLAFLKGKQEGLKEQLAEVEEEIKGFDRALNAQTTLRLIRPKIRPVLRELLNGNEMDVEELVIATAKKLGVEEDKVLQALLRWVSQDEQVMLNKETGRIELKHE